MADKILNCEGLRCPMPIVKLTQELELLEPGQTIEVTATDKAFESDVKAWIEITKNTLLEVNHFESKIVALIKKS